MPACDLNIRLDEPDRIYQSEDMITGQITVTAHETCRCNALWVKFGWATISEGNRDTGPLDSRVVFKGIWLASKEYTYDFQFKAPKAPLSYSGKLFNVYWRIRVEPELAEEKEAVGLEESVWILPGHRTSTIHVQQDLFRWRENKIEAAILVVLLLASIIVSVIILQKFGLTYLGFLLDISVLTALPSAFLFIRRTIGNRLAIRKLGAVKVDFFSTKIKGGNPLEMTLYFRPKQSIKLNAWTATLQAQERVVSGSTFPKTHTFSVLQDCVTLATEQHLEAGSLVRLKAHWIVPENGPWTFRAKDNELRWTVELHADIAHWPDWNYSIGIQVLPPWTKTASVDPFKPKV